MELVTPAIGLVFWTTLTFLLLLFLLKRMAWKPILSAVNEREKSIKDALNAAENAKREVANLKAENEKILAEAREERVKMIKEAKALGDKIIVESKDKAAAEYTKKVEEAKREIQIQKMAAITEVKNEVGNLAIKIATQILERELHDKAAQEAYITELVQEAKLN